MNLSLATYLYSFWCFSLFFLQLKFAKFNFIYCKCIFQLCWRKKYDQLLKISLLTLYRRQFSKLSSKCSWGFAKKQHKTNKLWIQLKNKRKKIPKICCHVINTGWDFVVRSSDSIFVDFVGKNGRLVEWFQVQVVIPRTHSKFLLTCIILIQYGYDLIDCRLSDFLLFFYFITLVNRILFIFTCVVVKYFKTLCCCSYMF